ncbi:pectin lyase fold/virulence factor [Sphaerosporella brunnea]|uniref:galacturonan 1,4-alpha-galacturonidase n=1 Tax=Sphaerosporella brunnea TaxID=1250544 RepID=A0A5J5EK26_9PEZI|nr:pectin lyase fold/virulence factor [Sphaerosporella brunnea]
MHIDLNIADTHAWSLIRRTARAAVTPHATATSETLKESLYTITAADTSVPAYSNTDYDFCHFSCSIFPVGITIAHRTSALSTGCVSPQKLHITPSFAGGVMSASLPAAGYYIVKLDAHKEVIILADPAEEEAAIPSPLSPKTWNVLSFGAKNDGSDFAATTSVFQSCLDAAAAAHGTVYVPAGVYSVGNLVLGSNTTLYLASGSTLRFSAENADAYKVHWHKTSQGSRPITWWLSTAFGSRNVRIFGRGVLDGNGVCAVAAGGMGNNLLVPIATRNFSCEGITFVNAASWAVTPILTTHARFSHCKFLNRFTDAGENDGIDVMHSSHILITRCIGVGLDDPFSTKTWSHRHGDISASWPIPSGGLPAVTNITFDTTTSWTICFGLKIGAGIWAPQENITFRNAVVYDCSIAVGIHFQSGASYAKNVTFENIDIEHVTWTNMRISNWCSFMITGGDANPNSPYQIRDVKVANVHVRMRGNTDAILKGRPGRVVKNVLFKDVRMQDGSLARNLQELGFEDVDWVEGVEVM